jgi:hypothetical protein
LIRAHLIRSAAAVASLLLTVALGVSVGASPAAAGGHPPMMLGPGDAKVNGIGHEALIRLSKFGFVYIAGKHDTHLTITFNESTNTLRYRDTRTLRVNQLPKSCDRKRAKRGIAVVCHVPARFQDHMFVQVWPRLGHDYVDGRTLPHRFRLWVLADAGRDVVHGGAGNDFVNGAKDNDRVFGGPGNDFIRTGPGNDFVRGGPGRDRVS